MKTTHNQRRLPLPPAKISPLSYFLRGSFQKSLGIFGFIGITLGCIGSFMDLYRQYPQGYHMKAVAILITLGALSFYLPPILYYAIVRFKLRRLNSCQLAATGIAWPWSNRVLNTATVALVVVMFAISVATYLNVDWFGWVDRYRR